MGKRKHLPPHALTDCTHQGKRIIKPTAGVGPEQVAGDHPGKSCMAKYRSDCQSFVGASAGAEGLDLKVFVLSLVFLTMIKQQQYWT